MRRREFLSLVAGATAWPLRARAEQLPVIGFLSPVPGGATPDLVAALRRGLAEEGYVEGKNLAIENRFTNFRPELMLEGAADFIRRNVNVIFAGTPEAVAAARDATTSIPIVGVDLESDPLAKGYVKSLARQREEWTGAYSRYGLHPRAARRD
jgi:putative ABC transport system substrate-binding protein